MRKFFAFIVLINIAGLSWNQAEAQELIRFGITAGPSFSGETAKEAYPTHYGGILLPHFGVVASIPLGPSLSLQPEILFDGNGITYRDSSGTTQSDITYYLKIPVVVLYHIPAGPGALELGAGAYVAKGLFGTTAGVTTHFGNGTTDDVRGGDFGLEIMAQYAFPKGFFVNAYWEQGVENILAAGSPTNAFYNHAFDISIGYFFGGKK